MLKNHIKKWWPHRSFHQVHRITNAWHHLMSLHQPFWQLPTTVRTMINRPKFFSFGLSHPGQMTQVSIWFHDIIKKCCRFSVKETDCYIYYITQYFLWVRHHTNSDRQIERGRELILLFISHMIVEFLVAERKTKLKIILFEFSVIVGSIQKRLKFLHHIFSTPRKICICKIRTMDKSHLGQFIFHL